MNKKTVFAAAALISAVVPSMAQEPGKFMRSSIYTVLVNSDEQNTRLDDEAKKVNADEHAQTLKDAGLKSLGEIPAKVFPTVAIPEQFNDHNLATRILDFDKISADISEDEAKEARGKEGASGAMKFLAGGSNSSILRVEKVDDYMHAALNRFLANEKVADMMVAKWYNYDQNRPAQFNEEVIMERGFDNASAADIAKGEQNADFKAMLSAQGFELMNNTFVVATNLRFRNNKAVAEEVGALAEAAAEQAGKQANNPLAAKALAMGLKAAAKATVNGLMKDQYSVTAVTNLYKLDWNDDIDRQLSDAVLYKEGATLEDLLNTGLCKLTYVGKTKARAGVKKNKEKTLDQLAASATARAIDGALAKLQVENEVFRTTVPVSKTEGNFAYAKIGTKEGVGEGDEYEILEKQMSDGRVVYKKVGSAKVEKAGVWFNTTGADEIIANADDKEAAKLKEAQDLGYTKFKASKKGIDGYYLRLAKKKGKVEDQ